MNDVRDIMRNSAKVLNSLNRHSKDLNYKYERLYRILFNTEMYAVAYQRIAPKQGNMMEGTDGKTIDGMSIKRIEDLIASLKDESYQPKPSRRTYIPKKNGKMRPLGIPATEDKLLQEVVKWYWKPYTRRVLNTLRMVSVPNGAATPPLNRLKNHSVG